MNSENSMTELRQALETIEQDGFGENVDADSVIEQAARSHLEMIATLEQLAAGCRSWLESAAELEDRRDSDDEFDLDELDELNNDAATLIAQILDALTAKN